MPEADGSVRIVAKFDSASLQKQISTLSKQIEKQSAEFEKASASANKLRTEYEAFLKTQAESVRNNASKTIEEEKENISSLSAEYRKLTAERERLNSVAGMLKADGKEPPDLLREEIEANASEISSVMQRINASKANIAKSEADIANADSIAVNSENAKKMALELENADAKTKALGQSLEESKGKMRALQETAQRIPESTEKSASAFEKFGNYVKRLAKRMLLLYAFRRVFTFIRNGIMGMTGLSVVTGELNNFISKMKEAYTANQDVQAALAGLRGALSTAFAPIYSAVIPSLISFINWLARVISYISAFISALGGGNYAESAKGADKLAKSIGGVGGAAKGASKQLAAFDKLNVLNEESGGGGGGGGGGATAMPEVDEDKVNKWERAGERIREIIHNIKTRIQEFMDWYDGADPTAKLIFLGIVLGTLIPLLFTLLSWPVAMAATLLILFTLVEKYYDQISEWLDGAYETIKNFFANAIQEINEHVNGVQKWLNEHFGFIGHIFSAILEVIRTVLVTIWGVVSTVVTAVLDIVNAIVKTIHAIATGDWSAAWQAWARVFTDVWNGIAGIAKGIMNGILGVVENMVNGVISYVNSLLSFVNSIGAFFGANWGLHVGNVSLPRFANGGFPDAGSMFIAGEAGPELVGSFGGHNNSVVNETQLVQAFQQASSEQVALLQQQNALLSAILNKSNEFTFKPSSAAGKAFSQSINMYSRAMGV